MPYRRVLPPRGFGTPKQCGPAEQERGRALARKRQDSTQNRWKVHLGPV